jgi:hypothetical protein
MSNDGLVIGNAIESGLRTYGQMQSIDANKQAMGLRDEQARMQREQHEAQMDAHEEEKKIRGLRADEIKGEQLKKMNEAFAWSIYNAKDMPDEYKQLIAAHPNLDAQRLMSDEAAMHLKTIEGLKSGAIPYHSKEVAAAFDFLNPEIALGATEKRKVKTSRLYPGGSPETLRVGLHVEGDPQERPLTVHRSSRDDDPVLEVSMDQQMQKAMIFKSYRDMLMSDQGRQWFLKTHLPQLSQQVSAKDQSVINFNKSRANYYDSKAKNEASGGAGGAGKLPADAQMIAFYEQRGYSTDDAIAMVNESKNSPQKFVTDYTNMLLETSKDMNGVPTITPDQAFEKSMQVYNTNFRRKPAKRDAAPKNEAKPVSAPPLISRPNDTPAASPDNRETKIKQILAANPGKNPDWAAAYLDHLANQSAQ